MFDQRQKIPQNSPFFRLLREYGNENQAILRARIEETGKRSVQLEDEWIQIVLTIKKNGQVSIDKPALNRLMEADKSGDACGTIDLAIRLIKAFKDNGRKSVA